MADALAAIEANRSSTQGDTNLTGITTRTCSYKEFRSCMQGNFSGTKGAVRLTRWFEKLESVFQVSKVKDNDNVKYVACTMLDDVVQEVLPMKRGEENGNGTMVSMQETYPTAVSVAVITVDLARPLSIIEEGQAIWLRTANLILSHPENGRN
ncbi:hypothetical protein Tco_0014699 [Tanacetum coccineum]